MCFGCIALTARAGIEEHSADVRQPRGLAGNKITFSVSSSFRTLIDPAELTTVLERSASRWEAVAAVAIEFRETDAVAVSRSGDRGDGISVITMAPVAENLALFYGKRAQAAAVTRLFFDRQGNIVEADIVLNPFQQFSTDLTFGTFDLETVFTHEIGHAIGLTHSPISSSLMFDGGQTNTLFQRTASRELSADDISRARALYGTAQPDPDCCGVIEGQVSGSPRIPILIWVQNADTGALEASTLSSKGSYKLGGIPSGEYDIYAQPSDPGRTAVLLGKVAVDLNVTRLDAMVRSKTVAHDIRFVGVNGQLTSGALVLEPGRSYRLLLAIDRRPLGAFEVRSTSPHIRLGMPEPSDDAFKQDASVYALEASILQSAAPGTYSLYVSDADRRGRYSVGVILVIPTNK